MIKISGPLKTELMKQFHSPVRDIVRGVVAGTTLAGLPVALTVDALRKGKKKYTKDERKKRQSQSSMISLPITLAASGTIGYMLGKRRAKLDVLDHLKYIRNDKNIDRGYRKWSENFHKEHEKARERFRKAWEDMGVSPRKEYEPKTNAGKQFNDALKPQRQKKDATAKYREYALKHHPDKGGNIEHMSDINNVWDNFKKHHFEKLAYLTNKIKTFYGI